MAAPGHGVCLTSRTDHTKIHGFLTHESIAEKEALVTFRKVMTMLLRIVCFAAILGMFVPNAAAKNEEIPAPALYKAYPADVGVDAQLLFLDRVTFIKDMYALSNEDMEKVLDAMQEMVGRQEQYDASRCITLDRLRIAIDIVASDTSLGDETKDRRVRKFQDQINRIHALAPLSFANVMKVTEKLLSAENAAAGRKRVLALLVGRTGENPEAIDVMAIDALLAGLVEPGELPEMPSPPPPVDDGSKFKSRPFGPSRDTQAGSDQRNPDAGRKLPPADISSAKQPRESASAQDMPTKPATQTPVQRDPKRQNRAKPVRVTPKIVEPAPPVAEWRTFLDDAVAKYEFSAEQKRAANGVVKSVLARAAKKQETASAGNGDARTDAQKHLDILYDEMKQRIDSIATIEQAQNAEGSKAKPAAEALPKSEKKPAE